MIVIGIIKLALIAPLSYYKALLLINLNSLVGPKTVGSGGRAVERRPVNQGDDRSIPPVVVSKLGNFVHPTFACVFRKRQ